MNTKLLCLLLAVLSCGGCANVSGSRTAPDGSVLKITTWRFFWASQNINFSITDTNRLTVTLKVSKSNVDTDAIAAAAEGAVKGMK